jgi:hypothetical protein
MANSIADVLRSAWTEFLSGAELFLPHLLAMLSLVLVGWLMAWLTSFLLRHVLGWVRFDALAERTGTSAVLRKVALPAASAVLSSLVFWLVWVAFLLSGLGALGFSGTETLAGDFVAYLPRLGVGIVILVVGMIAANVAWRAALLAAVNSSLPSARLLSGGVRWLILTLAVAMALEQLGVAKTIMLTAFAISFGAVMLGVGIAIGIGGAPVARRIIDRQFPPPAEPDQPGPDDLSHL